MKIGVIDADLIGKRNHRFPNLCCMKISGFYKNRGDEVRLIADVNDLQDVERVYIAKVFTSTPDPLENMSISNTVPAIRGGRGISSTRQNHCHIRWNTPCRITICMINGQKAKAVPVIIRIIRLVI